MSSSIGAKPPRISASRRRLSERDDGMAGRTLVTKIAAPSRRKAIAVWTATGATSLSVTISAAFHR